MGRGQILERMIAKTIIYRKTTCSRPKSLCCSRNSTGTWDENNNAGFYKLQQACKIMHPRLPWCPLPAVRSARFENLFPTTR